MDVKVAKMLWMLGQLIEYIETFARKSEMVFSEGFNADAISQPNLADLMEEREEDQAIREPVDMGPVDGELLLLTERGWFLPNDFSSFVLCS